LIARQAFVQKKPIPVTVSTTGLVTFGGNNAVAISFGAFEDFGILRLPFTMKCLPYSNVRRDGTDENDPEYDEIIQSRNDFSAACDWLELIP
jgi:hypothetical protein